MIVPALKTYSTCDHWKYNKRLVDGVIAAECGKATVPNASLGISQKVTKGSDSCSQWTVKEQAT